jgi:hypothetical protein
MGDNGDELGAEEPVFEPGMVERRVRQHLAAVRHEVDEVTGDSAVPLLVILNDIAQPLAEEVSAAQNYYTTYSSANGYLTVVTRFIVPNLHRLRQERLWPLCEGLAEFLREFLLYNMPSPSDQEVLVRGLERSASRLASRLDVIGTHVKQIADVTAESAPTHKAILTCISNDLQMLNATITASMTLLVGPFSVTPPASTGSTAGGGSAPGKAPTAAGTPTSGQLIQASARAGT